MGIHIWYLMVSILLVSTKAEPYDNVRQQFYERPESSSPSPPSASPEKEILLFLTPDQVESLKSAGAVVRPLPDDDTEFAKSVLQKQLQQNTDEYIPQYRTSNEDKSYDTEAENYYKFLNMQENNNGPTQQQQAVEVGTGETIANQTAVPGYKYTKSLQQFNEKEHLIPYTPKKLNSKSINQNTNSEYVRFLPGYETENLKMVPYKFVPLPAYRFEKKQPNIETNEQAVENDAYNQAKLYIQAINEAELKRAGELVRTQEPVDIESEKSQAAEEASVPDFTQRLVIPKTYLQVQRPIENKDDLPSFEQQQGKTQPSAQLQSEVQTSGQDKSSVLLAPLHQHQRVTEIIAKKKKELINHELDIRTELQKIKQAAQHDEKAYATELEKLTSNLGKQNALAEIEAGSKSPSVLVSQEATATKRRPLEIVKQTAVHSTPLVVRVSKPGELTSYPVAVELAAPKLSQSKSNNAELKTPWQVQEGKRIPGALNRNSYGKVYKPYTVQKDISLPVNPEIIENAPYFKPEQLTILRHIWEH